MITELKLSNFRLFDEEVTVRFRPITVLIGRNNSGKSSIIKFLLMLKQSLDRESTLFLNPQGDRVNLGRFEDLQNTLKKKEDLFFQLTAKEKTSSGDPVISYIKNQYQVPVDQSNVEVLYEVLANVSYQQKQKAVKEYKVIASYKQNSVELKKIVFDNIQFLDFTKEWKNAIYDVQHKISSLKNQQKRSQQEELSKELMHTEHQHIAEQKMVNTLKNNLNNLYHLGPVRDNAKEPSGKASPPFTTVGQKGQYVLQHLQEIKEKKQNDYKFILPYIQNVAGVKGIDFEKKEFTSKCFGVNKLTGAKVPIYDFGFGVSQCLPIFVQGALMSQYSSLMVEQPEAQLHPTAQLALGEFFADLWKKRQVGSILETHSDNILLRLRRLIAKGTLQPEDVSVAFFDFDEDKNQPVIKNLDIAEDGSMQEGLPWEFFGKNVKEIVKMGAGE